MSFVLRIKENNGKSNKFDTWNIDSWFMNTFKPGLYLSWTKVPTEGNHGPGPEYSWTTCKCLPSTVFSSKKEALYFWNKRPVEDVVPEVVQIKLKVV